MSARPLASLFVALATAALIALPAAADPPRAAVLDVQGESPPPALDAMTQRWRAEAKAAPGFTWIETKATLAGLQLVLDCPELTPACWETIGKRLGVDVLFVARVSGARAAFQRVETPFGRTTKRDETDIGPPGPSQPGPSQIDAFVAAGVRFVGAEKKEPAAVPPFVAAPAPLSPAPALSEAPAEAPSGTSEANVRRESVLGRVRWPAWVSAGAAVALLAGAVAMGASAGAAESDLNSADRDCTTREDYEVCRDLEDRAQGRALAANVLFALSGAAAVASGVFFYLDVRGQSGATGGTAVGGTF